MLSKPGERNLDASLLMDSSTARKARSEEEHWRGRVAQSHRSEVPVRNPQLDLTRRFFVITF